MPQNLTDDSKVIIAELATVEHRHNDDPIYQDQHIVLAKEGLTMPLKTARHYIAIIQEEKKRDFESIKRRIANLPPDDDGHKCILIGSHLVVIPVNALILATDI